LKRWQKKEWLIAIIPFFFTGVDGFVYVVANHGGLNSCGKID
jgi:hypothetical protein